VSAPGLIPIGAAVRYSAERIESFRRNHSGFDYLRPDPRRFRADDAMEELQAWRGTVTEHLAPHGNVVSWGYAVKGIDGGTMTCMAHVIQRVHP
jgi:hypothetical protein